PCAASVTASARRTNKGRETNRPARHTTILSANCANGRPEGQRGAERMIADRDGLLIVSGDRGELSQVRDGAGDLCPGLNTHLSLDEQRQLYEQLKDEDKQLHPDPELPAVEEYYYNPDYVGFRNKPDLEICTEPDPCDRGRSRRRNRRGRAGGQDNQPTTA